MLRSGPVVPIVALASPLACLLIDANQPALFGDCRIGLEMLLLDGAITFAGLWLASHPAADHAPKQAERVVRHGH